MTDAVQERLERYTAASPQPLYMGWYDASKHRTPAMKLEDAVRRYESRRGETPTLALVNADQLAAIVASASPMLAGLTITPAPFVAPDTFYVGTGEHDDD